MRKTVIALLAGLALLVLPITHTSAQEKDCYTQADMVKSAAEQGITYRTDLTGSGLKAFFTIFLETTQGSATPEEIEALVTQIDQIGIAVKDEHVGFLVIYKDGCAQRTVSVPRELLDHVMKQVEQTAINGQTRG